jgi:hypothetical protein
MAYFLKIKIVVHLPFGITVNMCPIPGKTRTLLYRTKLKMKPPGKFRIFNKEKIIQVRYI